MSAEHPLTRVFGHARACVLSGWLGARTATTYRLGIAQKPTYLHVVVTGRNTKENVAAYMAELVRECRARGCHRVLVEERLEGPRLNVLDVFDLVERASRRYRGLIEAMAVVDARADGGHMRVAEHVAADRGMAVRMFRALAHAEDWLLGVPAR
jgi:hypothetical protein